VVKESTLAAFLTGDIDAYTLAEEVRSAQREVDPITISVTVSESESDFVVTKRMALRLCEAVLIGDLPGEVLRTISFVIISSDHQTGAMTNC
jgi:hypothetical protein